MDEWQRLNPFCRIHWLQFPGGSGSHDNPWQICPIKDGPPLVKLNTGETFAV